MKKLSVATIIAIMLAAGVTFAQSSDQKLSETEQLKIQVLNLQYALKAEQEKTANLTTVYGQCQTALLKDNSGLQKATSELQDEITKGHDGFSFDITTGAFTPKPKATPVDKK